MRAIDIAGQKFGRLRALKSLRSSSRGRVWSFRCDCGKLVELVCTYVTRGNTSSCGCLRTETNIKHGFQMGVGKDRKLKTPQTQIYRVYHSIQQRCHNPKNTNFKNYGGRGVSVCALWRDSFHDFVRHVGLPPTPKHSLGRIDNAGNYEPGNVRWETRRTQQQNTRRNLFVTVRGETKCVTEWARVSGIGFSCLRARCRRGVTGDAFLAPSRRT